MNNKKKIIAGFLTMAFLFMGLPSGVVAATTTKPVLRTEQPISNLDINSETRIPNADSIVNLSLRDADLQQVLRMFADQAGMNIIFAPDISGSVTMDLVNVTLLKALSLVASTQKIKYTIQGNIMIITNADDEEIDVGAGSKDLILIPVKYVSAASIADFLNKNIFNKNSISPGASNKPVVTVNPANNELIIMGTRNDAILAQKIIDQFDKKPTITNFKVNHVTPAEMAGLICSTLIPSFMSNDDGESTGGAAGIPTGYAAGVPTGFASDSYSGSGGESTISIGGGKLLCSIDQKSSAEDMESFPFKNMTVTYFPTLGTIQVIGGSDTQLELIKEYIAANDIKSPQAYLEVQLISLREDGSKTISNQWKFVSKSLSFNAEGGSIRTWESNPIFFAGHGFTEYTQTSSSSEGETTSKSYGKWGGSTQLTWAINYLVENSKGRVLANPRILLTNGQQSVIDLTSDYVAKVTSQYLDSTGTGSSQVQKDYDIQNDNGIKITITPFISPDGYVTLDIESDYATIGNQLTTKSETGDDDLAATLLDRRNLTLKGVRIKDGETLVIGGMIQESETKTVNKIPVLGDLPLIGTIFRSTYTTKSKDELIIMLTPQILVDTEDAADSDLDVNL